MKKIRKILFLKFARMMNKSGRNMPAPSIISQNTKINGDLISNGIIHIDGQIEGDITCDELIIGPTGVIIGNINTKSLHLYGCSQGKINAENLFVAKTAKLIGEATHITIAIEPGAYIDGRCIRAGSAIPAEQSKPDLMITDGTKKSIKEK